MQINLITTLPPRAPRRAGEGPGTATAGGRCRGPGGVFWGTRWGGGGPGAIREGLGSDRNTPSEATAGTLVRAHTRAHACTYPRAPTRRHKGGSVVRCPAPRPRWVALARRGVPERQACVRAACPPGMPTRPRRRHPAPRNPRAASQHRAPAPTASAAAGRAGEMRSLALAWARGHTWAHAGARVYARGRGHTPTRARGGTRVHACARVYIYIYMQAHLHTRTCTPQSPPITLLASLGRVRPPPCLSFPIFPATTPSALGPSPPHSARSTHGSPRSSTPPSSTHPGGGGGQAIARADGSHPSGAAPIPWVQG